jgi:ZIP family zinc transporter
MIEATVWGLVGASSLLVGAILASIPVIHRWLVARHEWRLGLLMAFGAGVLVSAVAYDLFEEAVVLADVGPEVAVGLALGALTFFAGDELIARLDHPRGDGEEASGEKAMTGAGWSPSCSARFSTASPSRSSSASR